MALQFIDIKRLAPPGLPAWQPETHSATNHPHTPRHHATKPARPNSPSPMTLPTTARRPR